MLHRVTSLTLCLLLGLLSTGCAHTQLRHNTVHQAKTLSEIYEQQVLDNLAMFCVDQHALPYFAYPKEGTGSVTDNAAITDTVFNAFRTSVGFNGSREILEQWGLTPVAEPDKLKRMRCAYQRAVGAPLVGCIDCCELEKEWRGKPDLKFQVYDPNFEDKKAKTKGTTLLNPETGAPYQLQVVQPTTENSQMQKKTPADDSTRIYIDDDGHQHLVDKYGYVTIPQFDCNGPCTVHSCWFRSGSWKDARKHGCGLVGHYCGTYVWVESCYRDHLTRLTLDILDYAVNDAPKTVTREKEVEFNIDEHGHITTDAQKVAGKVKTVIAIDDPVTSAINGDAIWRRQLTDERGMQPTPPKATYRIPKEQTIRPVDGGRNTIQIQRNLRSINSR